MQKKSTMSEKQFNKLSLTQQSKELKKMTKRANVRLSLLEEKDSITLAYRQAYQYNLEQERESNRFYEGTKYKSSEEIRQAYKAVTNFLGNKSSTLQGVQDNVKDIVNDMVKNNYIDENVIKKMNQQEQRYAAKYIAQAGNKKLKDLEKNHIKQYAYGLADTYNKADGRKDNRFYRGIKFDNEEKLRTHLENMIHFYNAKTSTIEGYEDSVTKRIQQFRDNGVIIPKDREKEFFDFLSTDEFKKMGKDYDSSQVANLVNEARKISVDIDTLTKKFQEYLDTTIYFDAIQKDLGITPWEVEEPKKHKFKNRKK